MKRRTSILLEQEQYDRLERRARQRGTSVSGELRCAVDEHLGRDDAAARWDEFFDEFASLDITMPVPSSEIKEWIGEGLAQKIEGEMRDWAENH